MRGCKGLPETKTHNMAYVIDKGKCFDSINQLRQLVINVFHGVQYLMGENQKVVWAKFSTLN
jgi:hypothetical protein